MERGELARIRRSEPAALQRRLGEHARIRLPAHGAQKARRLRVDVEEREQRGDRAQPIAAVGEQDGIERRAAHGVARLERAQRLLRLGIVLLLEARAFGLQRGGALLVGRDPAHHGRRVGAAEG